MLRNILAAFAITATLTACSSGASRTVERPAEELRAMIQVNERALMLTHYFPSANHKTELTPEGILWRFTLNDRDYARMTITLKRKDGQSTDVSSHFEEVAETTGPGVPFLRQTARTTSEEILTATLDGRPINHAMLQDQLKIQAAKDPSALARGYMEATAQMYKDIQATGGTFSMSSSPAVRSSQPYDKRQPYDRTPAYDRN